VRKDLSHDSEKESGDGWCGGGDVSQRPVMGEEKRITTHWYSSSTSNAGQMMKKGWEKRVWGGVKSPEGIEKGVHRTKTHTNIGSSVSLSTGRNIHSW